MGIVARQSSINLFVLIIGVFLGAINIIVLYPVLLSDEEFGLTRILTSIALLAANIGNFGAPSILVKFLPSYSDSVQQQQKLLRYALRISYIGLVIILLAFVILKNNIIGIYNENAQLFTENYHLLFPLIFFILTSFVLTSFSKSIFKSVFPNIVNDIMLRLCQTVLLVLYGFKLIDFDIFIIGFVGSYGLVMLTLLIYLTAIHHFNLKKSHDKIIEPIKILKYSSANFLTGLSGNLTARIDSLMITAIIGCTLCSKNKGLESVAMYSWALYIVTIIEIPARAITSIAPTFISNAWKNNLVADIFKIYKSSAISQLVIGLLIYLTICINIDVFFLIKPEYSETRWVIICLGFSKLVHVSFGLNGSIINTSNKYFYGTIFMSILAVITYFTNLYFIPLYGIIGAAIATALSLIFYNLLSYLFLLYKFKMQPFTKNTIFVVLVGLISYLVAFKIEIFENLLLNSTLKTIILLLTYSGLILIIKPSDDINKIIKNKFKKT